MTRLRSGGKEDYLIVTLVGLLTIFGLAMLSSASFDLGKIRFGDTYYHLKHQLLYGLSFGVVGFFLASKIYYKYWEKWALPLMLVGILGIIFPLTSLGVEINGASRWIQIGTFSFQPAEVLKLFLVIYLAALFSKRITLARDEFRYNFLPFIIISIIVGGLLFAQPATGTAVIILGSALTIYLVSGARIRYVLGTMILGALIFAVLIYSSPYRLERMKGFIYPSSNIYGSNYQLNQALTAIGSGGVWGVGYGKSTAKYNSLPEPIGDSIFAVIAEELGFVGTVSLLLMFSLLVTRFLLIAYKSGDKFARLLIVGFASLVALQSFLHIGANSGLLPLTGVPLPFISYGGTSLAVFLTMTGIVRNISKYT